MRKNIRDRWENNFLRNEAATAAVMTGLFFTWINWGSGFELAVVWMKNSRLALYPAIVSAFGSLFGFVITAMSIILTWTSAEKFVELRRKPAYKQLWQVFSSTVRWLGWTTMIAVVALLVDQDGKDCPVIWYALLFAGLTVIARLSRCVWVLEGLINLMAPPLDEASQ